MPNRYHDCKARKLTWPMQLRGVSSKVVVTERQDHVGTERVQLDAAKRPVMNVAVESDQRQDVAVFAPQAVASSEDR